MWDLDDATPAQMVRRDELELIYLHLRSMDNCTALLKRTGAVPAAAVRPSRSLPGDSLIDQHHMLPLNDPAKAATDAGAVHDVHWPG